MKELLIANRGEIAIRIARTAAEMGIVTVAVYAEDDADSLHTRRAGAAVALVGSGARAYLDIAQIVVAAQKSGCDAVHPGYGFLSENGTFAQDCADADSSSSVPRPRPWRCSATRRRRWAWRAVWTFRPCRERASRLPCRSGRLPGFAG
ncbi:MAG: biotin carboxylase N-terminal domain-containing protein [Caulobacteraceae bacterium]